MPNKLWSEGSKGFPFQLASKLMVRGKYTHDDVGEMITRFKRVCDEYGDACGENRTLKHEIEQLRKENKFLIEQLNKSEK